jgi:hypothetical protein
VFDSMAGKLLAGHRFIGALKALHIPVEVSTLVDEFSVVLGSSAKAWAVVVQWLSRNLADRFTLSRQGERLLRKILKGECAAVVGVLIEQLTARMRTEPSPAWNELYGADKQGALLLESCYG